MNRMRNAINFRMLQAVLILTFINGCQKDDYTNRAVSDADGNVYDTVIIGTQVWMAENLRTTRFNDHSTIPLINDNIMWSQLTTPAYCWYNNDEANKSYCGALYNWYAVNSGKLCPAGWHIPSDEEFKTLEQYLGLTQAEADALNWRGTNQGTQLKNKTGWSNGNGDNTSGFTALPGGFRNSYGVFDSLSYNGYWWSATSHDLSYNSWIRALAYHESRVRRIYAFRPYGFSVRCIKD